ncbi:hypothetical protein ED733_006418 [Metarhizium rileyi]|uniref:Uncharacterized protein n=1 Tax=Metarhizium rileyi (strain RCEF 4871) TaxID=1649241 RepID=A0A5C6GGA2_METRR|nr:hypothetical protein ED733_006418 [Metarhizium rileyi]
MNPQAFRSACIRARPEAQRTGHALKDYFRQFSTSQSLAADESSGPPSSSKPSVRQRTRDAANEINSLVKRGSGSRGGFRGGNTSGQRPAAPSQPRAAPKVIDVKSLPRGFSRGRGGFRGRGDQVGAVPHGQPPRAQSSAGNRFSRPSGGRGSAVRGGRGGRGRGGGRVRAKEQDDDNDKQKNLGKRQDPFETLDPFEEQFDNDMRFGVTTPYTPSLTLDSLAPFAPATPTTVAGRRATVLANLSALGTADPVGVPQDLHARSYAEDLESEGVRFFADAKGREAAEQYLQEKRTEGEGVIIGGAEESVRSVVFNKAVRGEHEKMVFSEGSVGVARNWHLRAETYTRSDVESFEKKLSELVRKADKVGGKREQKTEAKA